MTFLWFVFSLLYSVVCVFVFCIFVWRILHRISSAFLKSFLFSYSLIFSFSLFSFSLLIITVEFLAQPAYRYKIRCQIQKMQRHHIIRFITNVTWSKVQNERESTFHFLIIKFLWFFFSFFSINEWIFLLGNKFRWGIKTTYQRVVRRKSKKHQPISAAVQMLQANDVTAHNSEWLTPWKLFFLYEEKRGFIHLIGKLKVNWAFSLPVRRPFPKPIQQKAAKIAAYDR